MRKIDLKKKCINKLESKRKSQDFTYLLRYMYKNRISREDKKVSFEGGVGEGHSRRLSERCNNACMFLQKLQNGMGFVDFRVKTRISLYEKDINVPASGTWKVPYIATLF